MNTTIIARVSKQANINKSQREGIKGRQDKKPSSRFTIDKDRTLTESERQCTFFLYYTLYLPGLRSQSIYRVGGTARAMLFSLFANDSTPAFSITSYFLPRETYMVGVVKKIMARYTSG